jgi:hypothetical protein
MKTAFRSLPHRSALATAALAVLVVLLTTLATNGFPETTKTHAETTLPTSSHVIVMEENHSFNEFIGSNSAPSITSLADTGHLYGAPTVERVCRADHPDLFPGHDRLYAAHGLLCG